METNSRGENMLKIGQTINGVIQRMDESQSGIFQVQKDQVFVRHVLLREEVRVRITKRMNKGYAAELVKVMKPSVDRVEVSCGIYERCGSCQLLHMKPEAQKQYKIQHLKSLCSDAKSLNLKMDDVHMMKDAFAYRNKIIIGFSKDRNHQIQAGFYEEFSHRIVPYQHCLLHPRICDNIIQSIVVLMKKLRIEPYEEDKRRGLLRHVLIRYGQISKQIMVVLVVNNQVFPARKNFVHALCKEHPEITTIIQNVNTRKTSVVLGDQERVIYGPGYIEDVLCDLKFRISAKSFYQINHDQTEVLYKTAIDTLRLIGNERVLDAYCGIGTIGMTMAKHVKEVIGVEINKDAVQDAKNNANANKIKNIRFICDDASAFMRKMANQKERVDIVVLDPPREGSNEEFIKSVSILGPRQVLYISCNPQTQIRDLKLFQKYGYVGKTITGVDLFPGTFHVESIVRLSKAK